MNIYDEFKEVKRLCKELSFTVRVLKGGLAEVRKKRGV